MRVDAQTLAAVHRKVAATGSRDVLWTVKADQLFFAGVGPQFSAEATVAVQSGPFDEGFQVAAPSALTASWLSGVEGDLEVTWSEQDKVLGLGADRSSIEIECAVNGHDFLRLLNVATTVDDATALSFGSDLWQAMADVAWASAASSASNADPRRNAVHLSYGKVWAVADGAVAQVTLDLPDDVFPMIPAEVASLAKLIDTDASAVAVDSDNRLLVTDGEVSYAAPLIAGEPFPDFSQMPNFQQAVEAPTTRFSAKAFEDAVKRLDRVDLDEAGRKSMVGARVQIQPVDESTLGLSVLVGKRKATEAIDFDGEPIDCVFSLPRLRNLISFAGQDEVELHHTDRTRPFYVCHGNRQAWAMGLAAKSL